MVVCHICLAQAEECNDTEVPPAKRSSSSIKIGTTTKVTVDIHKTDATNKKAFWKQPAPVAIAKQRKVEKKKPPKGKAGSARVKRVGTRSADVMLMSRLGHCRRGTMRSLASGHTLFIRHGELTSTSWV